MLTELDLDLETANHQTANHQTVTVLIPQPTRELFAVNGEFLVMLAHELRNPLSPMSSAAHIIENNCGENVLLRHASLVIQRQLDHTTRLIDNLLEVSLLCQNKLVLNKKTVTLSSIVAAGVKIASSSMESRKHRFTVQIPPDPIWLNADPVRLGSAIGNLLLNAAKFTENNGKITLAAIRNENRVIISIQDNGVGIENSNLPEIFGIRVDHTHKMAHGGGIGLGLTLTRFVVSSHGGCIEAHSEGLMKGSEFVMTLPTLSVNDDFDTAEEEIVTPAKKKQKHLDVLIVDDHFDASESTALLVKSLGHTVHFAHAAPHALDLFKIYSPDIVLLDIGLPGIDGYSVARQMRELNPDVSLIAVTGYGQAIDKKRSTNIGFDLHVVKPLDPKLLPDILNTVHKKK
jgi:CheY-like chemotaxis protein